LLQSADAIPESVLLRFVCGVYLPTGFSVTLRLGSVMYNVGLRVSEPLA
jgi:hypothetical protein